MQHATLYFLILSAVIFFNSYSYANNNWKTNPRKDSSSITTYYDATIYSVDERGVFEFTGTYAENFGQRHVNTFATKTFKPIIYSNNIPRGEFLNLEVTIYFADPEIQFDSQRVEFFRKSKHKDCNKYFTTHQERPFAIFNWSYLPKENYDWVKDNIPYEDFLGTYYGEPMALTQLINLDWCTVIGTGRYAQERTFFLLNKESAIKFYRAAF